MGMLGETNPAFAQWYFNWLDSHVDPKDGFWHSVHGESGQVAMAAAFHMFHNYQCFRRPWPNPRGEVDATLALQLESGLFGPEPSTCLDLDGVYTAIRASEQAGKYRWADVQ